MQPRRWHLRATSVSGARPARALDLGWIALAEGRFAEARELFKEALALTWRSAACPARLTLHGQAAVAAARRRAPRGCSRLPGPRSRTRSWGWGQALFERHLAAARAQTDPAEWDAAWGRGGALTIEQAAAEVLGT